jgi:hypothetical protein
MPFYRVEVEVDRTVVDFAPILDKLVGLHPVLSDSRRGWSRALITIPANSLSQAVADGVAVVSAAFDAQPISVTAMSNDEWNARDYDSVPNIAETPSK